MPGREGGGWWKRGRREEEVKEEGRRERELSGNLKWKEEGEVQYEGGEREGRQTKLRE